MVETLKNMKKFCFVDLFNTENLRPSDTVTGHHRPTQSVTYNIRLTGCHKALQTVIYHYRLSETIYHRLPH